MEDVKFPEPLQLRHGGPQLRVKSEQVRLIHHHTRELLPGVKGSHVLLELRVQSGLGGGHDNRGGGIWVRRLPLEGSKANTVTTSSNVVMERD